MQKVFFRVASKQGKGVVQLPSFRGFSLLTNYETT